MNNRSGNKRNNNQKKDLNNKSTDTDSVKNIKEFNKLSSVYIILNKYKILTLTIFFSALFLIFTTILSFWIYNSNLKQDEQLASLSNQLETMPQPISQGRLGLIIKKSNDKLMLEINEEIRTINNKINEIENLINSYPKPISEGKIGLIFDKKIQKINKDLEKKINQKQSSENNLSSTSKQNQEMINEIKNKLNNIQVSLAKLSQVIGSGEIEKSLIQEIIDIKSEKGIRNFETNSLVSKEDGLIESTDVEEDLT